MKSMNFLRKNKPEVIITTAGKVLYYREGHKAYLVDTVSNKLKPYIEDLKEIFFYKSVQKFREIDQYLYRFPTTVSNFSIQDDLVIIRTGAEELAHDVYTVGMNNKTTVQASETDKGLRLKALYGSSNSVEYYLKDKISCVEIINSHNDSVSSTNSKFAPCGFDFYKNRDVLPYALACRDLMLIGQTFETSPSKEVEDVVLKFRENYCKSGAN